MLVSLRRASLIFVLDLVQFLSGTCFGVVAGPRHLKILAKVEADNTWSSRS